MKMKTTLNQITLLLSVLLFISCSSNEEDPINTVKNADYLWYFSGKIDGVPFLYGQKADVSEYIYGIAVSNTLPSTCAYSEENGFSFNSGIYPNFDESLPTMDIEFIRMHLCSSDLYTSEVFNDLFPVKEYNFAMNYNDENINAGKVGMYYSPSANSDLIYTTYNENTSENYFEITKSTANNIYYLDQIYTAGQTIEGNFAIKLYNENDSSDVIEITEGKFKMEFNN